MSRFLNFLVQLDGRPMSTLSGSGFELLIVESGYPGHQTTPSLQPTGGWSADLPAGEGQVVLAYLNTSVTDHNRSYWDTGAGWVTPFAADPDDLDSGTLNNVTMPAWLSGFRSYAFGPETDRYAGDGDMLADGVFGFVVNYSNAAWQDRLVAEAEYLMQQGYDGIYLDDVGQYGATYFLSEQVLEDYGLSRISAAFLQLYARQMMDLVMAVSEVVDAYGGYLAVNGGAYIVGDAGLSQTGARALAYYEAVDILLMEGQYAEEIGGDPAYTPWTDAQSYYGPSGTELLAVETLAGAAERSAFYAWAASEGILALDTVADYSELPSPPPGNGSETIHGTDGDDTIYGGPGDDLIFAGSGNDVVFGGGGDDTIYGGPGNDTLYGGGRNDVLFGGGGADQLFGQGAEDVLVGGGGTDQLSGGAGANQEFQGGLPDGFVF